MNLSNLLPFNIFRRPRPAPAQRRPLPVPSIRVTPAHMAKHLRDISSRRQSRIPVHIKARSAWMARTRKKAVWSQAEVEIMRQAA